MRAQIAGRELLIPAAALLEAPRIELLYAVAVFAGALTLLFEVAYRAFVPALLWREQLPRSAGQGRPAIRSG